jgi:hypothetical protein
MREPKLRSGLNWQGALKQERAQKKGCVNIVPTIIIRGKKYVVGIELRKGER